MRYPFIAAAILAAFSGAPAAFAETAEAAEEAPAAALPAINVATAEKRQLQDRIIATGLISAVEQVQVAPLVEGQPIEKLLADVGDIVTEGQVLAVLSNSTLLLQQTQFAASLAQARASLAQAEAQLVDATSAAAEAERVAERTDKLREQGSASQAAADSARANATSAKARLAVATQGLEAARAQLEMAEAQVENVALQLNRTEVKAPVAGEITNRNAEVGAIASGAAQPMFSITRDGALELKADVAESDVLRLAVGQKVNLRVSGATETLSGTVRLVEPAIDAVTRLGRARIVVDDATTVRAGMFAEAEIITDDREVIAVPVTAISSYEGKSVVMKLDGDTLSRVEVTTGIRDSRFIEVTSGLTEGDVVVAKATGFVRDGDRINPVPVTN